MKKIMTLLLSLPFLGCSSFDSIQNGLEFQSQLKSNVETDIVLINEFVVHKQDEEAFIKSWKEAAEFLKTQPGFISTKLHRGIGSQRWINYARWSSTNDLKNALSKDEFKSMAKKIPGKPRPHVYKATDF